MRTLLLSLAIVLGAAQSAHAGGYLSVGLGADALLGQDFRENFDAKAMTLGRVSVGARFGSFAIEGVMFGADLRATSMQILGQTPDSQGDDFSTTSLGIEGKYYFKLFSGIEGYGKLGINRTWLTADATVENPPEYQGQGYTVGAGLQYGLKVLPSIGASIWLDYNRQMVSLDEVNLSNVSLPDLQGSSNMITIGLTLGG